MADTSRRSFLKGSALAGTAAIGVPSAHAQQKSSRKLKIGAFGATKYTFWGLWMDLLSPDGTTGTDLFNMEVTHIWDKDMSEAQKFADKWGVTAVKNYDDMLGKVDGVVCGGLLEVPWQHLMYRPYIDAGVPCYLSRPWSYRKRDLNDMLERAAKNNTPLIASATYEHYNEADSLPAKLKTAGTLRGVQATCGGRDFPHFHIQHMMSKILGYDVKQVALLTNSVKDTRYLQLSYVYNGTEEQPEYVCTMQSAPGPYVFSINAVGTEGTVRASMPGTSNYFWRFAPQLIDIQKTIEGKQYQPLDVIRKKHELWITAHYSHVERNGAPVDVGTVPNDWSPPYWEPGWMDNAMFKQ